MTIPPGGGDRREAVRYRVNLRLLLHAYRRTPSPVRMHDISTGGAMVAIEDDGIARGDEVMLDFGSAQSVATVAWRTEGYLGLAFHRPLRRDEIDEIRRRDGADA